MIKKSMLLAAVCLLNACGGGSSGNSPATPIPSAPPPVASTPPEPNNWALVWNDEFDGNSVDQGKWSFEENCKANGDELQCYTSRQENVSVSDGNLHIKVRKERFSGPGVWNDEPGYASGDNYKTLDYTSGRLRSKFKGDWTYGRIEVKAKLPGGQGMWPAVWMLPTDSRYGEWPASGEIDIVEAFNNNAVNNSPVYGTLHYGATWPGYHGMTGTTYHTAGDLYNSYHTYAIEWEEDEMRWYVDDIHYATQTKDGWFTSYGASGAKVISQGNEPFDQRFHVLLNVAVTGNTSASVFPQEMTVDYVRVYTCPLNKVTGKGCATHVNASIKPLAGAAKKSIALYANGASTISLNNLSANNTILPKADDAGVVSDVAAPDGNNKVWDLKFNTAPSRAYLSWGDMNNIPGIEQGFNLSPMWDFGQITFDLFVESMDDTTSLKFEMDSAPSGAGQYAISGIKKGEWKTYIIPFANLKPNASSSGPLNFGRVSTPFAIVAEGGKAHLKLNNIRLNCIGAACGINAILAGTTLSTSFDVYIDAIDPRWNNGLIKFDEQTGSNHMVVTTLDDSAENRGNILDVLWTKDADKNSLFYVEASKNMDVTTFTGDDYVSFDIKVLSYGSNTKGLVTAAWCTYPCGSEFLPIPGIPADNKWHTVSLPLSRYTGTGLNMASLKQPFVFAPAWGDQSGVHVQLDNIRWIKH